MARSGRRPITGTDVLITATGAPHPVIYADDVATMLPNLPGNRPSGDHRHRRPARCGPRLWGDLPGVRLFDIDYLESPLHANLAMRQAAVPQVEAIVQEDLAGALELGPG